MDWIYSPLNLVTLQINMGHLSVVQTSSSGLASKKRQTSEGGAVFDI